MEFSYPAGGVQAMETLFRSVGSIFQSWSYVHFDTSVPLLDIRPNKYMYICLKTFERMFTAIMLIIGKYGEWPKCQSTVLWIKHPRCILKAMRMKAASPHTA